MTSREDTMQISRRDFISTCSATIIASSAVAQSLPLTTAANKKKGLAGVAPANSGLTTSWYYDWSLYAADQGLPPSDATIQFHPMCWGWRPSTNVPNPALELNRHAWGVPVHADNSSPTALAALRAQKPKVLFGFNEPDVHRQSNIKAEDAALAWSSFQGLAEDLVSPSCGDAEAKWMEIFMGEVERHKLQLDSVGFHHYGPPEPDEFIRHLDHVHALFGRPVWVTEFAVADWEAKSGPNRYNADQVAVFMKSVCAYMNKTHWVKGYAWFPRGGRFGATGINGALAPSILFKEDGTLTGLGQVYATV
jgi:hypothetical protein